MPAEVYYALGTFISCMGILLIIFFKLDSKISSKVEQSVSNKQWEAINEIVKTLASLQASNAVLDERSDSLLREIASLRKDLHLNSRMENIENFMMKEHAHG